MKINWGTGITIFIVLFVTFILSFVFAAARTHTDLYAEDYYQQEIDYQSTIEAKSNAQSVSKELFFSQGTNSIIAHFPPSINMEVGTGKIHFYRPNNADVDATFNIENKNDKMILSKESLIKGKYDLNVCWIENGKDFIVLKELIIE